MCRHLSVRCPSLSLSLTVFLHFSQSLSPSQVARLEMVQAQKSKDDGLMLQMHLAEAEKREHKLCEKVWLMYACMYACMYVCECMHVCMHVCLHVTCTYVCIYARTYACSVYACMYACMYVCMYVCMRVCTYAYMHVCTCVPFVYVCMYVSCCNSTPHELRRVEFATHWHTLAIHWHTLQHTATDFRAGIAAGRGNNQVLHSQKSSCSSKYPTNQIKADNLRICTSEAQHSSRSALRPTRRQTPFTTPFALLGST